VNVAYIYGVKNAVIRDVTPCGSCMKRRFGGTYRLHNQGDYSIYSQHASAAYC
jgi:hypothetical protein